MECNRSVKNMMARNFSYRSAEPRPLNYVYLYFTIGRDVVSGCAAVAPLTCVGSVK